MSDDDIMHTIAAWDWLAVIVFVVALIAAALLGDGGMANW